MRLSDEHLGLSGPDESARMRGAVVSLVAPVDAARDAHPIWIEERARIAVNRNVRIAGHLVFQESIRIDGHFRGEVSSSELVVISENGSVRGRVRSPRLIVLGDLEGDIIASKSVLLGPHSRFKGKVEAENLTICEGAYINGDLRIGCRSENTRSQSKIAEREPPVASA
jgi:cytoskeletal protein CcmA (bactofilin family)